MLCYLTLVHSCRRVARLSEHSDAELVSNLCCDGGIAARLATTRHPLDVQSMPTLVFTIIIVFGRASISKFEILLLLKML